jgi:membrane protein
MNGHHLTGVGMMVRFMQLLWKRFADHHVPDLAAQLSFYFLLSIFPFLLFALTLLAYLPISTDQVVFIVSQYLPASTMSFVEANIRRILDIQRPELLSFSLFFALWSASHGSHAVIRALNLAYEVSEERSFICGRLVALALILGLFAVFLIALILPVFGRAIGLAVANLVGLSEAFLRRWDVIRWLLSIGVTTVLFCFVYLIAPNTSLRLGEVWIGAVLASIGWQAVSLGFSVYVEHFGNFSAMYGGIGGVVVFMLWLYLAGMVLLLGGEINSTLKFWRERKHVL